MSSPSTSLRTNILGSSTYGLTLCRCVVSLHCCVQFIPCYPTKGMVSAYKIRKAYDYILEGASPCVRCTLLFSSCPTSTCLVAVGEGTEVTFTSPNPEMYPLPDPRYLAFHATVAKVVHAAGTRIFVCYRMSQVWNTLMGCYVLRRDTLSLSNCGIVTLEVDERGSVNVSR